MVQGLSLWSTLLGLNQILTEILNTYKVHTNNYQSVYNSIFSIDQRNKEQIMMILIPVAKVPGRHISQLRSLAGKLSSYALVLEMFVDTNNKVFYDCDHNNDQLEKIVDFFLE